MKRCMMLAVLTAAAVALVLRATPASAAQERAFQATIEWTRVAGPPGVVTLEGTGNATHLGYCTGVNEVTVWVDSEGVYRAHATPTLTDTQGNQISLDIGQVWNGPKGRWEGTYTITGGTGKFESCSGYGTNMAKPTGTPGVSVAEFEGIISY